MIQELEQAYLDLINSPSLLQCMNKQEFQEFIELANNQKELINLQEICHNWNLKEKYKQLDNYINKQYPNNILCI